MIIYRLKRNKKEMGSNNDDNNVVCACVCVCVWLQVNEESRKSTQFPGDRFTGSRELQPDGSAGN